MSKVIVGLSGGVDSSVAAKLLLEEGYEVEGLFMKNWDSTLNNDVLGNPNIDSKCISETDFEDAKCVADLLNIKLHRVDFVAQYWDLVFKKFLDDYKQGKTPNPDVLCNKHIKFDLFIKHAKQLGADYVATGHFARLTKDNSIKLLKGVDNNKDQTYFLAQVKAKNFEKVLFPVGHLTKAQVREIAYQHNFITAQKKDSTGICFIGERHFNQFLTNYIQPVPGNIVTNEGQVIGKHQGLIHYTIGQRKGIGLGGDKQFGVQPWFVIGKNKHNNNLIVGQGFDHPDLYSDSCTLINMNWFTSHKNRQLTAKFRYRQQDKKVIIDIETEKYCKIKFVEDVRAVTPGQLCVLYDESICIGSGFIDEVFKNKEKRKYV